MKITVDFTPYEASEVLAKLANQLEVYNDEASDGLIEGFLKVYDATKHLNIFRTTLTIKWFDVLQVGKAEGEVSSCLRP